MDALLANENGGDYGCLDRSEIDNLLGTPGMAILSKLGKDNSDKLLASLVNNNIYSPIESNKVIRYMGIMSCSSHVELEEIYSQVGNPIDTYVGTNSPSNVCMLAGLTYPKTRLNEIKAMAQTNAEIIKKGMDAANNSLFDDGDMDFLGTFDMDIKPKMEEKESSLDILNEFL